MCGLWAARLVPAGVDARGSCVRSRRATAVGPEGGAALNYTSCNVSCTRAALGLNELTTLPKEGKIPK